MKSSLKYNLFLPTEKKKVANLDDLRKNFNIEDILDLYKNKDLQMWLESRSEEIGNEYSEIVYKISKLNTLSDEGKLMKLIYMIFFPKDRKDKIKKEITSILHNRAIRKLKTEVYKNLEGKLEKEIGKIVHIYLDFVNKIVVNGRNEFKETFDTLQLVNDNWSQLFKLQCASIIQKLSEEKCNIALLGIIIFDNLKRILFDEKDKLTVYLWVDNHLSIANFCKSFVKEHSKKTVDYNKYIEVKKISDIFISGKGFKIIESSGDFLIMNIPANCKVKNNEDNPVFVGNICKGKLILSLNSNFDKNRKNSDSILNQFHYIKLR